MARPKECSLNTRTLVRSLFALFSTVVAGCTHLSLKDKAVREIRVQPVDAVLCPGQETKIAVTAVMAEGPELATTGAGHGKVGWDNYKMILTGGTAKDGKIRLSSDPRVTWNKPGELIVEALDHPGVQWTGAIAVRYDCEFEANFAGATGTAGSSGRGGKDGGSPGGDAADGEDGSAGDTGNRGQKVDAWVTTVVGPGQKTLVQAAVSGDGGRSYYAFDPTHGTLTIDASGGAGGAGGAGGDGGDGGKASKDVKQGRGGDGGKGDCGGHGGDGGDVWLHVDPSARPYLERVVVHTHGGDGGDGGQGGSGGKGDPRGRKGKGAKGGEAGDSGHLQTAYETVAPLW
jgi:hypothetical protein